MMNMLQTIFLENIFLALVEEEKVGEKRSTAKEMMLTCQMIQIINFLKKAKTWVIDTEGLLHYSFLLLW